MATRGLVKWFDPKKGYGFIVGPEGQDVFVHYSQIQGEGFRSLKDGEAVDYELSQGDKGYQARDVRRTTNPADIPSADAPLPRAPARNPSMGYRNTALGTLSPPPDESPQARSA